MEEKELLKTLCEGHGPSGREHWLHDEVNKAFSEFGHVSVDNLNNIIVYKRGKGKGKIMLMAHLDEIFMSVTAIKESGFLEFRGNGIDVKTLVSQEVIVHGEKDILGIIGIKPPHLMKEEERAKAVTLESLLIDTGYSKESLEKIVKVGDYVTVKRDFKELLNGNVTCKALDDRAGVVSLYTCAKELKNVNHDLDVYFVCSAQEEVGHRGAKTASNAINPDIGIAVDVTFDSGKMGDQERDNNLGQGPVICIGPNIHPRVREKLMEVAEEYNIPYQVEVEPGDTGTDAWDIQIAGEGIPTLLICIPLKYMHTSVEVVNMKDVKDTGRIMAKLIEKLNGEELEGLLCY
ncbi:M42 family metallopeptidase [Clostridium sp. UBA4548]|uniref:M42 family metallopeptidase n=1 Tax=Clostridium sp. UBA4548 TaxID=1946361 RepID=UPI0025C64F60|nr:M42 family metallopeptidase [Clostridium sp. UBA4548]